MEENNSNNPLEFNLEEIIAELDKPKKESAAALEMLVLPPSEKKNEPLPEINAEIPKDPAESLSDDFGKLDEAPMKEAMTERDDALRDTAAVASGSVPPSAVTYAASAASSGAAAPEISVSTVASSAAGSDVGKPGPGSNAGIETRNTSYGRSTSRQDVTMRSGTQYASGSQRRTKEKKYVTRGGLAAAIIVTLLLSSLLGAFFGSLSGGGFGGKSNYSNQSKERNDSRLSQLNLSDATGSELTVAQIVDKNEDAVVEITVSGTTQGLWGQMQLVEGAGSGVIIREDGYIATNYHVIQGARKVQVTLHNGQSYPARIIGSDSSNDVAVIKIEESGLTTAIIGDSSTVSVGDLAVAIGNPLGQLGGTATSGIISALDRTLSVEGTTLTLLQTDAAINGGNSGGGLFNSRGELIGIVESKASAVGVEGLAFALPINSIAEILNDIIESGSDVNGKLAGTPAVGIVISDVSEDQAQYYGLVEPGLYIAQVTGYNAQLAGFKEQDMIVSFNGAPVDNSSDFISMVRKCKIGDTVTIVVRRDGQAVEIKTVLEELQTN